MNLLSHAFLARDLNDDLIIIGTSLPDLLAMWQRAHKISCLREFLVGKRSDPHDSAPRLIKGIDLHLSADRDFHASEFFLSGQRAIRRRLEQIPALPVKRFFLAHILLEMLLDRFLIDRYPNFIDRYYQIFSSAACAEIANLVEECFAINDNPFRLFLDRFIASRFLYQYRDLAQLVARAARMSARVMARRGLPLMDQDSQNRVVEQLAEIDRDLQEEMNNFFAHLQIDSDNYV